MEHLTEYQIFEYFSGEPDYNEKIRFEEHLKICPDCQKQVREYQEDLSLIEKGFPKEPPQIFWVNYLPKLRRRMDENRVNEPGFLSNTLTALSGVLVAAVIFALTAGWFPENTVDLNFEEWFADNLTYSYIYYVDDDYIDEAYNSEFDLQKMNEILPGENEYDILQSATSEELEEALQILKDQSII